MNRTEVEFTFDEAVRALGVTPERLDKLIAEGKVQSYRDGIRTVIPRHSIVRYLSENNGIVKRKKS